MIFKILLWCFAPKLAMQIRDLQQADRTCAARRRNRSSGIRLPADLLLALCDVLALPTLLKTLMVERKRHVPRVQNVTLAVNLAAIRLMQCRTTTACQTISAPLKNCSGLNTGDA